ncbi:hypothetical protein VTH06DRAFT_1449 [Thermothelomyces fergusii]
MTFQRRLFHKFLNSIGYGWLAMSNYFSRANGFFVFNIDLPVCRGSVYHRGRAVKQLGVFTCMTYQGIIDAALSGRRGCAFPDQSFVCWT